MTGCLSIASRLVDCNSRCDAMIFYQPPTTCDIEARMVGDEMSVTNEVQLYIAVAGSAEVRSLLKTLL